MYRRAVRAAPLLTRDEGRTDVSFWHELAVVVPQQVRQLSGVDRKHPAGRLDGEF